VVGVADALLSGLLVVPLVAVAPEKSLPGVVPVLAPGLEERSELPGLGEVGAEGDDWSEDADGDGENVVLAVGRGGSGSGDHGGVTTPAP
jgi:hypothetical protein